MIINEILTEDPQIGDSIDIEIGDVLIETVISDITENGIVVYLDETAIQMFVDGRRQLSESRQRVGDYCDACDRKITSVPHVCPGSEKLDEAEYQGRKVSLGKPFLTPDGPKKRAVYVKNPKGNVVKVNFGQKGEGLFCSRERITKRWKTNWGRFCFCNLCEEGATGLQKQIGTEFVPKIGNRLL